MKVAPFRRLPPTCGMRPASFCQRGWLHPRALLQHRPTSPGSGTSERSSGSLPASKVGDMPPLNSSTLTCMYVSRIGFEQTRLEKGLMSCQAEFWVRHMWIQGCGEQSAWCKLQLQGCFCTRLATLAACSFISERERDISAQGALSWGMSAHRFLLLAVPKVSRPTASIPGSIV